MLAARVASAIVAGPIVLAAAWYGGLPLVVLAAAASFVGADEASRLISASSTTRSTWLQRLGSVAIVIAAFIGPTAILALLTIGLAGALLWSLQLPALAAPRPPTWTDRLGALLYPSLSLALLVLMRSWPGPGLAIQTPGGVTIPVAWGAAWVILALTTTWIVDSAAYLVGRAFGRHLFSPRISPRKTWEGTLGGVGAGALWFAVWSPVLRWPAIAALLIGLGVAWAAVLGDLVESSLKRHAGVKDSGAILPGHGGLLDRIDSLAFSTAVVFLVGTIDASIRMLSAGPA